jgi:branched-chain amino acid transport system permease protein
MTIFIQTLVGGLSSGTLYGGLALALVMIFRSTGVVNFAQGELAMISAFLCLTFFNMGLPVGAAIAVGVLVSFVMGVVVERVFIRPVSKRGPQAASAVTLGLFLGVDGVAGWIWGQSPRVFPSLFPERSVSVGGVRLSVSSVGVAALLLAVVGVVFLFFERTRLGLMMRAAASNGASAALSGVPVSRLLMLGWGIAAAIGALVGALIAPSVFVSPSMMGSVFVYALASAALGGLASPIGALVGGWIIGVAESLVTQYVTFIGTDLIIVVPLVAIFAVLSFRPAGLLGRREVVRV